MCGCRTTCSYKQTRAMPNTAGACQFTRHIAEVQGRVQSAATPESGKSTMLLSTGAVSTLSASRRATCTGAPQRTAEPRLCLNACAAGSRGSNRSYERTCSVPYSSLHKQVQVARARSWYMQSVTARRIAERNSADASMNSTKSAQAKLVGMVLHVCHLHDLASTLLTLRRRSCLGDCAVGCLLQQAG